MFDYTRRFSVQSNIWFSMLFATFAPFFMSPTAVALEGANVYFIGHSLVNFNMPHILDVVADKAGKTHNSNSQIINGSPLRWNWDHHHEAQGSDSWIELPTGKYDILVLTEATPLQTHMRWNNTIKYAGDFLNLSLVANPETQGYLYATWPPIDGVWVQSTWDEELDADLRQLEDVASQVTANLTPNKEVFIIPANLAMRRLRDEIASGHVPGLSNFSDVFQDGIHMNELGNYFIAMVHYATIYRESPVGLTGDIPGIYGGTYVNVSEDLRRVLQQIAWAVVSTYPKSGVSSDMHLAR